MGGRRPVSPEEVAEMRERRARGETLTTIALDMGWGGMAVQKACVGVLPKWATPARLARSGLKSWQNACPECGQPKARTGNLCRKCQLTTHPSTGRPPKPRFPAPMLVVVAAKTPAVQPKNAPAPPLVLNVSQTICNHYWLIDNTNHGVCCKCGEERDFIPQFYYGHTYEQKEEEVYA